ncbi:MAG: 5-formyltetrahydrofolate cyclo-ligase [Proteobacteria bacterium]|nr:5-formyltetrahydrofolate cyclo-ligase [Pseudomonadota bacterium]
MTVSKAEFRNNMRKRRADLARAHPDFARAVAEHVAALKIADSATVGGYIAINDEADPHIILKMLTSQNCELAFPRVVAKGEPLAFHRWQPGRVMAEGAYGIPEPSKDWPLAYPKILLVPLLAFDANGHRLGYGGGYYDRTLDFLRANSTVRAIGVAYAGQEVDALPREDHDHPLDAIITENGVREFTRRTG